MREQHESFNRKTQFVPGEGLKIPVFDMSLGNKGDYLIEPETKRNSILELLFSPADLESLVIVKPDPDNPSPDPLKKIHFGDEIQRRVAFSSGNSIYYADAQLSKKLNEPFITQPDHACRYGSLLVSSCNEGGVLLDSSEDGQALRIKIVDFESQNAQEKKEALHFQTGDCHGKISPRLAKLIGGKSNRPFQFRLAWLKQWQSDSLHSPSTSFLAKGTFLPNQSLTEDQGYDLILDRSSIKGIAKNKLNSLIPCGDYELPQVILGNRGNAKIQDYENSWQMSIWYSESAIQKDLVPPTQKEAQKLSNLQKDPLLLAQYLVEQYDKKKQLNHFNDEDSLPLDSEEDASQPTESRLITILRHDKYGQLLDFPKVADFMRNQLANRWRDLAIKGAIHHGSAMAQPCDTLKRGTIVAPHLQDGEEVIVTRYPIVSKDNIRRYTVNNAQKPELQHYRGCAFIRSDQAMQHHQCDFDGDQLVITPASRLPHLAAETRHANEENEYDPVEKRKKVDYTKAKDAKGQLKYTKLRQIAVAVPNNSIGYIATLIGRVQSSVPQSQETPKRFEYQKRKLLAQLFDALQIEVDSPKSATRFDEVHPKLIQQAKKWAEEHPSHFFDFKKDERLYKTVPLPTEGKNAINALAREAVNPLWSPTRIRSRHRHEFRYLFPSSPKIKGWEEDYLSWAKDLKERANSRGKEIHRLHGNNKDDIKQEYGKLYEDLRGEIVQSFPKPQDRKLAAAALWYVETTHPNLTVPRKECAKLSRKLQPTFELVEEHQRQYEAISQDTYLLTVPFEDKKGQDYAGQFKTAFQKKGIAFEATLHPTLPMVQFALLNPSHSLVQKLEKQFGDNDNLDLKNSDLTYYNPHLQKRCYIQERIVPPTHYNWLENDEDITPKSALVLNLFSEEIAEQLQKYRFEKLELIGQKYNDFANVDFCQKEWQKQSLTFEVKPYDRSSDVRHGHPIVTLQGKPLAMFSVESPKLPIGATFEATIAPSGRGSALTLKLNSDSVQLPMLEEEKPKPFSLNLKLGNPAQSQTSEASQVLHAAIAEKYAQLGHSKIAIAQDWTAFINRTTDECFVRDSKRKLIFRSNLTTGEITQPLSGESSQMFTEKVQQLDSSIQPHSSFSLKTSIGSVCKQVQA